MIDTEKKHKRTQQQMLDGDFTKRILQYLAPRHTESLQVLARMQLQLAQTQKSKTTTPLHNAGVRYEEWKQTCLKEMKITKESDLQSMMKELVDHGILSCWKEANTWKDIVCIQTDQSKLQEIMSYGRSLV